MNENEDDWVFLPPDNNQSSAMNTGATYSSFATVPMDRPIDREELDESDPLNSNIILKSYNISDREAVIQVVPNFHGSLQSEITSRSSQTRPSKKNSSSHQTLRSIQMKLESKQSIQQGLIDHPMAMFPRAFFRHFIACLWNSRRTTRAGFVLIVVGLILQFLVLLLHITSQSILASIHTLIFRCVPLALLFYLFISPHIQNWIQSLTLVLSSNNASSSPMDPIVHLLASSNLTVSSKRFFLFMILGSTLLQMRVITFLSYIITQQVRWVNLCFISMIHCAILIYRHFRIHPQGQVRQNSSSDAGSLLYTPVLCFSSKRIQVYRKCSTSSLEWRTDAYLLLYFTAFLLSWMSSTSSRTTKYTLGAPFFIATGCFLLTYPTTNEEQEFDYFTNILRYSLRLAIRDVMTCVGENIAQDEMLQIALLRWIVDYWAHDKNDEQVPKEGESFQLGRKSATPTSCSVSTTKESTMQVHQDPSNSMNWDDLSSMLSSTIHTLQKEVQTLETGHESNSDCSTVIKNTSLFHLQRMLDALDVDVHAKPAVAAYKQAIENFPPSRETAIAISIMRRCPAFLSIVYLLSIGSRYTPILAISLLPMIGIEFIRIQVWIQSCWVFSTQGSYPNKICWSLPEKIDTMYMLLSGDYDIYLNQTPPLFQVWKNIVASVKALESGLVAARYVHTAHVASKVATNVLSLAELAWTVKNKGLMHGVSTVAAEIIRDHSSGSSFTTTERTTNSKGTQYSRAVVYLIKIGNTFSKNISHLWEEKKRLQYSNDPKKED